MNRRRVLDTTINATLDVAVILSAIAWVAALLLLVVLVLTWAGTHYFGWALAGLMLPWFPLFLWREAYAERRDAREPTLSVSLSVHTTRAGNDLP